MRSIYFSLVSSFVLLFGKFAAQAIEASPELLSASEPTLEHLSAGGDSHAPIVTPDGRYILFTSVAPDLVSLSNNFVRFTPRATQFNVFLRDRIENITRLISISTNFVQDANGDSLAIAVSTNGQFVLFESSASNLVTNDHNGYSDIFLHDVLNGTTQVINRNTNGASGNGESRDASMTPDGRFVAFVSDANDLGPTDTNSIPDVYVRDTVAQTTVLGSAGAMAPLVTSQSAEPQLSDDGRYLAFSSTATNLVQGVRSTGEVYLRDLNSSITYLVSGSARSFLQSAHGTTNGVCFTPLVSAEGSFVVFQIQGITPGLLLRYSHPSAAVDLISTNTHVPTRVQGNVNNVAMSRDGQKVAVVERGTNATTAVRFWDANLGGTLFSADGTSTVPANTKCHWPVITPNGSWLAYFGRDTNAVSNRGYNIVRRDLQNAETVFLNERTNSIRFPVNTLSSPCLSADGALVVFESDASDLVENDRNNGSDIFVRQVNTNIIELVSVRSVPGTAAAANDASGLSANFFSSDGTRVAFASDASNLVLGDTNGLRDIFVRDLGTNGNVLVSGAMNSGWANGSSWDTAISGNGRFVAFTSRASNLAINDGNSVPDVFLRDLQAGVTKLVSLKSNGSGSGNGASGYPVLSADGRYVLFRSSASDLAAGGSAGVDNIFVRDMNLNATRQLSSTGSAQGAVMTTDGTYVVWGVPGPNPHWIAWNNATQQSVRTNFVGGLTKVLAISSDLSVVASGSSGISAYNLQTGSNVVISATAASHHAGASFSADGQRFAYSTSITNGQVFLYDFVTRSNILVSRKSNGGGYATGHSDAPAISGDGRFIVYRSDATDIVPGDQNSSTDIFVYDCVSETTVLLSSSINGNGSANGWSHSPRFAADGKTLLFASRASDLSVADSNDHTDLFMYRFDVTGTFPVYIEFMSDPNTFPRLFWPAKAGVLYRIQYKNSLEDAEWQDLDAEISISGTQASAVDMRASPGRSFYRVLAE